MLKIFSIFKFLEGNMCVVRQPFLYSFTLVWPCSNCIYMLRGLLQEVSDLCSSSESRKFLPANMFQICLSGAKIQRKWAASCMKVLHV